MESFEESLTDDDEVEEVLRRPGGMKRGEDFATFAVFDNDHGRHRPPCKSINSILSLCRWALEQATASYMHPTRDGLACLKSSADDKVLKALRS